METLKTGLRLCYAKLVLRTTESTSPAACQECTIPEDTAHLAGRVDALPWEG